VVVIAVDVDPLEVSIGEGRDLFAQRDQAAIPRDQAAIPVEQRSVGLVGGFGPVDSAQSIRPSRAGNSGGWPCPARRAPGGVPAEGGKLVAVALADGLGQLGIFVIGEVLERAPRTPSSPWKSMGTNGSPVP
jgi:hypothetical protein